AGHGKTLREAVNDDGALGHAGEVPDGFVGAAEDNARVNFVGDDPQVVLSSQGRDCLDRLVVINRAGWIVGGIENQHARFWRDLRGDFAEIRLKTVFLAQRERYRFAAEAAR